MMKTKILACMLALAPAALAAQTAPPELPRDTVPTHAPVPLPPAAPATPAQPQPPSGLLADVGKAAAAGAVMGAVVAHEQPECALASTPGGSAAFGAATGAVWGGLRALFGRHAGMPTVLPNRPARDVTPAQKHPPVVDERCVQGIPAARIPAAGTRK
jgi:hypothetical protein